MSAAREPKALIRLSGEIKTPPFSEAARFEAGSLLRCLQNGETLGMPACRPMPGIGPRCLELRVRDENRNWRIICRVDRDAVLVVEIFAKATRATPPPVIVTCRQRLRTYDDAAKTK